MASFTQTLTVSVRCFGGGPSSLWNAYSWNAFKWGEGTATIPHAVLHFTGTTLTVDPGVVKNVQHLLNGETVTLSDEYAKSPTRYLTAETLTLDGDLGAERLGDGSGYEYVFHDRSSNAEDRFTPSWSSGTAGTASWTTAAAASSTWSES